MSQKLDKKKICESIRKSPPQKLLLVTINPADKDSKKNALAKIEKFILNGNFSVVIYAE
jgi:hypothetical protein